MTRILLADDHQIVRQGLRYLLEAAPGMVVVGEAEDGRKAVQLVRELVPDVVIMDVTMPGLNGIDATREIVAANPGVKVVGLSMHSDRRFVAGMLSAGACGYVRKDCAFEEMARAVRAVAANETYLDSRTATVVIEDYVGGMGEGNFSAPRVLTGREREVLQLLAEGRSTKEIAACLRVSVKTVESHRQHIMEKLRIRTVAGLTKYAVREGLSALEE